MQSDIGFIPVANPSVAFRASMADIGGRMLILGGVKPIAFRRMKLDPAIFSPNLISSIGGMGMGGGISLTLIFAAAAADRVADNLAMKVLAVAGDRAAGPKASEIVAIASITAAAFSTSFKDTGKVGGTTLAKTANFA